MHVGKMSLQFSYKQTEVGRIPKEWEVGRLSEFVDINGESIDPSKDSPNGTFLYIDIDSVENGTGVIRNAKEIVGKDAPSRARRIIHHNDVLMSTVRPYLKAFTIVPKKFHNQVSSTGFAVLTCTDKVVPLYLLHTLFTKSVTDQCKQMMVGGQYPALTISQVENIRIPIPPLSEQKKIAEILSTVDQAIERVNEAIEETQRLKKGLMQELLTKGIGHKEFKETEIGRIPKEWELRKLGEIGKLERGKFAYRPRNDPRFYGGKFPFIQTGDIGEANGVIKKYFQTLNEEGLKISKMFKKGTIVISIAGNIGDVGILDFDSCFPDSIVGIKGDSEKVNNLFLMYLLQKSKRGLDSIAPRSTQKNINLGILEAFKLPLPSLPEQQKITEILSAVDDRLGLLRARKERLGEIKKGLMNDLLTGRKRVKLN